jgi:hypothetical protein
LPIAVPDSTGWDGETPHWVCFNDDCEYFRDGWDWMWQQYRQKVSYRYRVVDLETGATSPLAVRSARALRNLILSHDE